MDYTEISALASQAGFTCMGPLDPRTIELKELVRQMCTKCHVYDKRWSCPPGCGTLDACRERVAAYHQGILVQTVGQLEDEFDGEGMMEAQQLHKAHFEALHKLLGAQNVLALGAGSCMVCKVCSYPDEACRFPERMVSSMEAYGMEVAQICRANDMPYNHGKNTIAYTSCVLF